MSAAPSQMIAAQALHSLVLIFGVDPLRYLLQELAEPGSSAVGRLAGQALHRGG
jgi:hypothetical protein